MQPHTQPQQPESPPPPLFSRQTRLTEAVEACSDALHFLAMVDLALTTSSGCIPSPAAVCTVLAHVGVLVERARDLAEFAGRAPHG